MLDFRNTRERTITLANGASPSIDHDSPVPLYYQLYLLLVHMIESGQWPPDSAIPTEKELNEQYRLSRTTTRQAILQLVSEGYLTRHKGRGTFVTKPKVRHGPQRSFGITGYMRDHGLEPGWRFLKMERVIPPKKVSLALGLQEKHLVLEITRLRLANDEVIGLHIADVPFPLANQVQAEYLTQGDSSLYYLEKCLNITLSESHRIIEAVPARPADAKLLKVAEGSPLLSVQRTTIAADGKPIEHLRALYPGDRFEYYVHLEH